MTSSRRVALVTGANRGIGKAVTEQLAERGIHVIVAARDLSQACAVANELARRGLQASPARLDVTDPATVTSTIEQALDCHGRIDILVNNAGISDGNHQPSSVDLTLAGRVWEVNVLGAWRCAQAVVPTMVAARYGRVVNLSSNLGSLHRMTQASEPAYRVSKAALNALTRVLAAELAGTGVLVNSASPGWVRTDLGGPNAPRSAREGADTPVWLATLPDDGPSGGFFYDRQQLEW